MTCFRMTRAMQALLTATATLLVSGLALASVSNFQATNDAANAVYSFSYTDAPPYVRIFLDTDRNSTTGYRANGLGSNYLIENSNLYRYSGSNGGWGWTLLKGISMVKPTSNSVRFTVLRSDIGNPTALNVVGQASLPLATTPIINQTFASTVTTTTVPLQTITWTRCATENGTCSFAGTRQVRYGVNGSYAYKTATGSIACNNATFGDPAYGYTKYCDYSSSSTTTTTIPQQPPVTTLPPSPPPTTTVPQQPPTTTTVPPVSGGMSTVSYAASTANILNPERGFFWMTDCRANPKSVAALQAYKSQNSHTILHCMWYLRDFKSSPISSTVLSQLQTQMNNVRTAGFKMIIRFAYTNTDINDAPLSVMSGHLDQLRPYLQNNGDIIATMQVGMIGQWGEMSTSANFGGPSSSTDWANRKALVDKMLSVVPANRMVAVRTPAFKMNPYGSSPLTSAEAFSGTSRARVSHYNDCFISSSNDMGTYLNSTTERPYMAEDTKYVAMSGETCAVASQNDCAPAMAEMAKNHWSLLHEGYHTGVYDKWKSQGCFGSAQQRLGYRFILQNASFSTSARSGGAMNVAINLRNDGFASMYNERKVELLLRNNSTGAIYRVNLNTDPRRWLPGAIAINQTVTLPTGIPAGTYSLLLNLPDPAQSLYGRPEYSVQLANSNVWEATTGFNKLNASVVIQ